MKQVFCKIKKIVFSDKNKCLSTKGSYFEQGRLQIHKSGKLPRTNHVSKVSAKGAGVEEHPVNCRAVFTKSPDRLTPGTLILEIQVNQDPSRMSHDSGKL